MKYIILAVDMYHKSDYETLDRNGEWHKYECDCPMTFDTDEEAKAYIAEKIEPKYPHANCYFVTTKYEFED